MQGDDLAIVLFFVSSAVTFVVTAITVAGWRHPILIWLLVLLGALSAGGAAGWIWGKTYWPAAAPYVEQVGTNPVSWFVLFMFTLGIVVLGKRPPPAPPVSLPAASGLMILPNTVSEAISLEFGSDEKFEKLELFSEEGVSRRTSMLKVQNVGNGFLSDCKVVLIRTVPKIVDRFILLVPSAPMFPGQYRYFSIAYFFEKAIEEWPHKNEVVITEYYGGGWSAGPVKIEAPTAEKPLFLTIEATAAECNAKGLHLKIWVEQPSRRMRIDRA